MPWVMAMCTIRPSPLAPLRDRRSVARDVIDERDLTDAAEQAAKATDIAELLTRFPEKRTLYREVCGLLVLPLLGHSNREQVTA